MNKAYRFLRTLIFLLGMFLVSMLPVRIFIWEFQGMGLMTYVGFVGIFLFSILCFYISINGSNDLLFFIKRGISGTFIFTIPKKKH